MVYFIQSVNGGPIKIGKTERIDARFRELQLGRADELKILGLTKHVEESNVHKMFSKYRIRGEWFTDSPELLDYINSNSFPYFPRTDKYRKSTSEAKVIVRVNGKNWKYSCEKHNICVSGYISQDYGEDLITLNVIDEVIQRVGPFAKFIEFNLQNSYIASNLQHRNFLFWSRLGWLYKNGKPVVHPEAWERIMDSLTKVSVGIRCVTV